MRGSCEVQQSHTRRTVGGAGSGGNGACPPVYSSEGCAAGAFAAAASRRTNSTVLPAAGLCKQTFNYIDTFLILHQNVAHAWLSSVGALLQNSQKLARPSQKCNVFAHPTTQSGRAKVAASPLQLLSTSSLSTCQLPPCCPASSKPLMLKRRTLQDGRTSTCAVAMRSCPGLRGSDC